MLDNDCNPVLRRRSERGTPVFSLNRHAWPSRLFLTAFCLLSTLFTPPRARSQDRDEIKGAPAEPADAEEVRQLVALVEKMKASLPDRGAALYFLAVEKQHLRETREALALLKECVALQDGFDPSGDPSFSGLKGTKEFDTLIESVHRDFPVVAQAREAFRTTEKDLFPEGLAYDSKQNIFYMGSIHRRKIVKINADGIVSDFVPGDRYSLLPVIGIRVDPNNGSVWANSFEDSGRTELLHFDVSGTLLGRFKAQDTAKHGFNDLVVRKNGEVIVTDSLANAAYSFAPSTHTFAELKLHRALVYPNGIALSGGDHTVYVADAVGVVAVDLASGESRDVDPGPKSTLAAIDGLYWYKGSLVAVQNGIGSPRIVAFHLSNDGFRVTRTTVLENRSSFTVLPTTGAIRGSDFYFMANTQVDNLNGDKVMDLTRLEVIRIGVLRLP